MTGRSGFSLVEIMIGILILAVTLGSFITGIRSARREVEVSDKHISVLLCSQKVIEDLMEEIWLNPFGFQTLGIENSTMSPTPITQGQSVFFTGLETGSGRNVIGPEMKPLYHQIDDLELTVSAERQAPVGDNRLESNLYLGNICFTWNGRRGQGDGQVEAIFFSPGTPKKFTAGTYVTSGSDASYTAILGSPGGKPKVLRNLGDVYRACRAFMTSDFFSRSFVEVKRLKKLSRNCAFPGRTLYNYHYKLAGTWYEMARRSLNFLISTEPAISAFAGEYFPGSLGSDFEGRPTKLNAILRDFRLIYETLVSSLLQARANYQFLVTPDMAKYKGIRMQYHLIARVMDLYRVLIVTPTHRYGLAEYRHFLEQLDRFGEGRCPALRRMVAYELDNSDTVDDVVERLPNLKQLDTLFARKMRSVLGFIRNRLAED